MYSNMGAQRYHETNISTITREKMIVLLYEKIISDLNLAAKAIGENDRVEMNKKVNHAQRIVAELRGALDHNIGGEVSKNLDALYGFIFGEQLELLVDMDTVHIKNCIEVLNPLLDAWKQIPAGTADKTEKELGKVGSQPSIGTESADDKMLAVERARAQAKSQPEAPPPSSKPSIMVSA